MVRTRAEVQANSKIVAVKSMIAMVSALPISYLSHHEFSTWLIWLKYWLSLTARKNMIAYLEFWVSGKRTRTVTCWSHKS